MLGTAMTSVFLKSFNKGQFIHKDRFSFGVNYVTSFINLAMLIFTENHLHNFQSIILYVFLPRVLSHRTVRYDDNGYGINRQRQISVGIILKEPDGNNHIYFFPASQIRFAVGLCLFVPNELKQKPMYLFSVHFSSSERHLWAQLYKVQASFYRPTIREMQ